MTLLSGNAFQGASHFTIKHATFTAVSNDEKEKIQKWLNAPDCTTNFQAADDQRTKGTGQWILNHPKYIQWKKSPNALWIQGKAGSGKTILSTTIIRDLKQAAPENVWYHYFDSRDNTGQKSKYRGFLLSLLHWAGANSTGIHPALKTFFDKCSSQGLSAPSPTVEDLEMILKQVFKTLGGGYVVLDAMDEGSEPLKVLEWLENLPEQFYILFTSRYSPEGSIAMRCLQISLDSRTAEIDDDIGIYLDQEIKKYNIKGDLRDEVISTLKEKAQGQFRWVDCQLRALEDCGGIPGAVRDALVDLPEDLEQTYNQAIDRTFRKKGTKQYAHHLLLWLLYSLEPLDVEMVEEILTIDLKNNRVEKDNKISVQIHAIIDSTLVAVAANSNVQLAHASVKEFLIVQYSLSHTARVFPINEVLAHEKIAQTCIIYVRQIMQFIDINSISSVLEKNPLSVYAVIFWTEHARCIEEKDSKSQLHHIIVEFATTGMQSFHNWTNAYADFWDLEWDIWEDTSPIYYLIMEGRTPCCI
ncbi:hypothetical protein GYMLUDRAFT_878838 [Collybiopsis luxurians FD-317 M1]|uniref:NACHT domain-containing protein n=1 Tax=Collybiopsis luxurians FD-317 M1 TaxID=944289 RepID=A0A0D0BZ92_9AGAR|nr:hypothetical protein GYMLUDRAFT_878838 [Collybiopsis luxurians FD-317 M1]